MGDINTVTLTGRLGSEIEMRETKQGTAVAESRLAVETGFGDNKKTAWLDITMWGKTAEAASKFLSKGRRVAVSGRLEQDEWDDKNTGQKRTKIRVVVENWAFADSEKKGDSPQGNGGQQSARQEAPGDDDNIPW